MPESNGMRLIHNLLWILVVLIFAATGVAFYHSSQQVNLQKPNPTASLKSTLDNIERLDKSYTEAIATKAQFRDIWCLVAIIVAAIGAGAVTLRAPQSIVISLGTYLAVVYGLLEFQSPQKIVNSLSNARGSLICVESAAKQLIAAKEKYQVEISGLIAQLEPKSEVLIDYSTELSIFRNHLKEILKVKLDERSEAVKAIDNVLLIAINDNSKSIDKIDHYLHELRLFESFIDRKKDSYSQKAASNMISEMNELKALLKKDRLSLSEPQKIRAKLENVTDSYHEQLVQSEIALKKSDDQLQKISLLLPRIGPAITSLKIWPDKLEQASFFVNNTIQKIHGKLIEEIALAGPTIDQVAKIVKTVQTDNMISAITPRPVIADGAAALADRGYSEFNDNTFENLQDEVNKTKNNILATLAALKPNIEKAYAEINRLEEVFTKYFEILNQVIIRFREVTRKVDNSMRSKGSYLKGGIESVERAEHILSQFDIDQILSEIESCVSSE